MSLKISNARKLIIGPSYHNYKAYQIGINYRQPIGSCRLTDIVQNKEDQEMVDIYLKPDKGVRFLWKSIHKKTILEVEYDSNYGQ